LDSPNEESTNDSPVPNRKFHGIGRLGSVSTCVRGGFGGWHGRRLVAGDRLPLCRTLASAREEFRLVGLDLTPPPRFRALPGPQNILFSEQESAAFFASQYTVSAQSDRMGMRLVGRPFTHERGRDFVSDAVAPGSIQIPANGQPIVLLADRQTTGGYPKIATVISADLPALGCLAAGAKIAFEPVTLEAAETARRKLLAEINSLHQRIVPLRRSNPESSRAHSPAASAVA
jgi:allophanate hydrolase